MERAHLKDPGVFHSPRGGEGVDEFSLVCWLLESGLAQVAIRYHRPDGIATGFAGFHASMSPGAPDDCESTDEDIGGRVGRFVGMTWILPLFNMCVINSL